MGYRNTFKLNGTDAKNIVQEAISKGLIKGVSQYEVDGSLSPLIPYVEKILNYDESPWVQSENRRKIDRLSRANVKNMESAFRLHAKPHIDPKTTIIGFSKLDAQKLQDKMHEAGASPDNINMAIKAMRTAYNFAVQTDIVDFNPFSYVKPYSVKRREREILSRAEAKQVLEFMQIFAQESPSRHVAYLAAKLAVYGGMREAEIRVFSLNKLKRVMNDAGEPTPFYKVDVSESWVDAEMEKGPTKERYKRTTVIHEDLVKELIAFAEKYGRSESGASSHRQDSVAIGMITTLLCSGRKNVRPFLERTTFMKSQGRSYCFGCTFLKNRRLAFSSILHELIITFIAVLLIPVGDRIIHC